MVMQDLLPASNAEIKVDDHLFLVTYNDGIYLRRRGRITDKLCKDCDEGLWLG